MKTCYVLVGLFIAITAPQAALAQDDGYEIIAFFDPNLPSCDTAPFDQFSDVSNGVVPCGSKQCLVLAATEYDQGISPYSYSLSDGANRLTFESNRYRYELELSARIELASYLMVHVKSTDGPEELTIPDYSKHYEKMEEFENGKRVSSMVKSVNLESANFEKSLICRTDTSYKFVGVVQ